MMRFWQKISLAFFLMVVFLGLSLSQVRADFCTFGPEFANCFPSDQAQFYGLSLSTPPAGTYYTSCLDARTSNTTNYTCINNNLSTYPTCPSSGATCRPYGEIAAPGPILGGWLGCTSTNPTTQENVLYACCSAGYNTAGYCISMTDWLDYAGDCCDAGETSCTVDGVAGYCARDVKSDDICQGHGRCVAAPTDTSDPGTFWCNCTNNGANWICNPSAANASVPSFGESTMCKSWSVPDTGRCSPTLPSNRTPSFCDRVDGGRCSAELDCISQVTTPENPLKGHGEVCTFNATQDECNEALGLRCRIVDGQAGNYRCAYTAGSRGGVSAPQSASSCLYQDECSTQIGIDQSPYNHFECWSSFNTLCNQSGGNTSCACRLPEGLSCDWSPLDNEESDYHGRPAYCVRGFSTPELLHSSNVTLSCAGGNCGGLLGRIWAALTGYEGQVVSLRDFEVGHDEDGYYTCLTGSIDESVKAVIADCLQDKGIASAVGGGTGFILGAVIPGPNIVTIPVTAAGGAAISSAIIGDCGLTIRAETVDSRGISCSADLRVNAELQTEEGNFEEVSDLYSICRTNLEHNAEAYSSCTTCMNQNGIWTAIGCIEQNPRGLIQKIMNIGIGILGGIFLLRVLAAGFTLTVSQGDVKRTSEAKEMLTESIIGVLFILFSVTILQFIGQGVLNIPGFGGGF